MGGTAPEASVSQANCTCGAGFTGAYRKGPWKTSVLAGSYGSPGRLDGAGTRAMLSEPQGLSFSPDATFIAVLSIPV